jgi:cytochrome c oxidase subunit II
MTGIPRRLVVAGILLLVVLILLAGSWMIARLFFPSVWGWPGGMMDRSRFGDNRFENREFASNGEQIYLTGTSRTGPAITARMPGGFGMGRMRGRTAGMACVDCHGEDGQGGTVQMMMDTVEVPSIQYTHLTEGAHDEGEAEHPPYTDETLKRAIREGINPAGEPLDWPMPVWNMSDNQLNDLIAYLKTLL